MVLINICNERNIMNLFKSLTANVFLFFVLYLVTPLSYGQEVETYIHPKAEALMPVLKLEAEKFAPEIITPWYFPGLIEHESCISLRHKTCWSSTAELRNKRERGVGLGQLSAAWSTSGKLRFDNLAEMKRRNPQELSELSWDTIKSRPDLQIRSAMFMVTDSYRMLVTVQDPLERLKMTDSAYNGGIAHVHKARTLCGLTKGCDPQIWDDNVVIHLPKSKRPDARYGGRSMYEINVGHVVDVFETRMPKFEPFFEDPKVEVTPTPSLPIVPTVMITPPMVVTPVLPASMPASGIPYRY